MRGRQVQRSSAGRGSAPGPYPFSASLRGKLADGGLTERPGRAVHSTQQTESSAARSTPVAQRTHSTQKAAPHIACRQAAQRAQRAQHAQRELTCASVASRACTSMVSE